MKINNKIIVSTLALAMGAALAGSISGTVAWYQYSTRAQAAFIGTTVHCSEALEIQATAVDGSVAAANWKTELTSTLVSSQSGVTANDVKPITSGAMSATDALPSKFYSNPIYQNFEYGEWIEASSANYYQFELHFHVKDIDGGESAAYLSKSLYLTDLSIVSLNAAGTAEDEDLDLYKAVRVHIACGSYKQLFANGGASGTTVTTAVGAKLDLNNDGNYDKTEGYEWDSTSVEKIYGADGNQVANDIAGFTFADDSDPSDISGADAKNTIGTITAADDGLTVTVTIWLEGWQKLATGVTGNKETTNSAVWNAATYVGKKFGVGFRFGCDAHVDHNA